LANFTIRFNDDSSKPDPNRATNFCDSVAKICLPYSPRPRRSVSVWISLPRCQFDRPIQSG
jgi:hypothetical protein